MGFLKQLISLSLIFCIAHSSVAFAGRHGHTSDDEQGGGGSAAVTKKTVVVKKKSDSSSSNGSLSGSPKTSPRTSPRLDTHDSKKKSDNGLTGLPSVEEGVVFHLEMDPLVEKTETKSSLSSSDGTPEEEKRDPRSQSPEKHDVGSLTTHSSSLGTQSSSPHSEEIVGSQSSPLDSSDDPLVSSAKSPSRFDSMSSPQSGGFRMVPMVVGTLVQPSDVLEEQRGEPVLLSLTANHLDQESQKRDSAELVLKQRDPSSRSLLLEEGMWGPMGSGVFSHDRRYDTDEEDLGKSPSELDVVVLSVSPKLRMSLLKRAKWRIRLGCPSLHPCGPSWKYGGYEFSDGDMDVIERVLSKNVNISLHQLAQLYPDTEGLSPCSMDKLHYLHSDISLFIRRLFSGCCKSDGEIGSIQEDSREVDRALVNEVSPLLRSISVRALEEGMADFDIETLDLDSGSRAMFRFMNREVFENRWSFVQWLTVVPATTIGVWASLGAVPVLLVSTNDFFYDRLHLANKLETPMGQEFFVSWVMTWSILSNMPKMNGIITKAVSPSQGEFTKAISRVRWCGKVFICGVFAVGAAALSGFLLFDAELTFEEKAIAHGWSTAPMRHFLENSAWAYILESYIWAFDEIYNDSGKLKNIGQGIGKAFRWCFGSIISDKRDDSPRSSCKCDTV